MPRNNLLFAAAALCMMLFGVVFLSLGSVNNMLAERFGLDENDIGTLAALLPFGILLGSLLFGPIVDRFGYRGILVAGALVVGAALEGLAFATSAGWVRACMFLIGLGGGVLNGAANALAADVSEGQRGARLSLLGVFFGVGALAMPAAIAVLSEHFDTPSIVAGIGALVVIPVAYCLAIRFPPPKLQPAGTAASRMQLLRDPIFLIAGLALAVQSGMEGMSNDWISRYFKLVTLAGQESAEWQTQLGLISVAGAMLVTRLVLSSALKHIGSSRVLLASIASTAAGAAILWQGPSYSVALLAAFLIGAGLAAAFPVVLSYIADRYPQHTGVAFSTVLVIALAGNMAINKTFGYIAHIHGIAEYARVMLVLLAISATLIGLLIFRLRTTPPIEER